MQFKCMYVFKSDHMASNLFIFLWNEGVRFFPTAVCPTVCTSAFSVCLPAASIWFEIWGSWIRSENFYFFQGNFRKISISPGNFLISNSKMSVYPDRICHLQLQLGKLFNFPLKYVLSNVLTVHDNIIQKNDISRPVLDPQDLPATPQLTGLMPMVSA